MALVGPGAPPLLPASHCSVSSESGWKETPGAGGKPGRLSIIARLGEYQDGVRGL